MEHKPFAGRNALVIAVMAIAAAALLIFARETLPSGTVATATLEPAATADASKADAPVEGYLLVTVGGGESRLLPLTQPGRFTVTQGEKINIIEVTRDSVWMTEASCDNQDCVMQGKVTLENMDSRALQNMIICLPHEVVLQLYTRAQLESLLEANQEGGPADE